MALAQQQAPSQRGQIGQQADPSFGIGSLLPIGLSLFGGILGGSGTPDRLSAEQISQMFGAQAVSKETQELFRLLQRSPAFQQMMTSASLQGQSFSNRLRANIGRGGQVSTPGANFARAASLGFGGQLQRQGQGQLFGQALQAAIQNLQGQMTMFGQQQQLPSFGQQLGSSLLGAGAQGFASQF